jgi:cation:H+ antiporter
MAMQLIGALSLPGAIVAGSVALVVLVLSANTAVKKMVDLAEYFKLSATFMGMTVVSLATSIPEITAHLTASGGILAGTLDYEIGSAIVLGSNIGSDIVQQTLILGMVVWVAGALYFRRYFLWKSMIPMIATSTLCIFLALDGTFSRIDGLILFALFVGYTYYLYVDERRYYSASEKTEEENPAPAIKTPGQAWAAGAVTVGMMLATVLAAQAVLGVIERVVSATGVGGSLIGVVTLGVASALPELTTALAGARNNAHGISLGTLIGSNITNPLVAIGLGAIVSTYYVPRPLVAYDLPWATVSGALLLGYLLWHKGRIGRWGAVYFVAMYALYITFRALFFAVD